MTRTKARWVVGLVALLLWVGFAVVFLACDDRTITADLDEKTDAPATAPPCTGCDCSPPPPECHGPPHDPDEDHDR